jgi:hypothetical protein
MIDYFKALRVRRRALQECAMARADLVASVGDAVEAYASHPLPALASAAGLGFVVAQLRVGSGLVRAGLRIAAGPAWRLVRTLLSELD